METRANHVWVGVITLALMAALAAFILWLTRMNADEQAEYDVYFQQSVDGLAKGSEVTFSGVAAGQVQKIELWKRDPDFVRVRIRINKSVPILLGTTATIQGSFTGVSKVQLDGAVRGAPPIVEIGPDGAPVIPTKPGGLGEILSNAPLLLERLATLTERLTMMLSDKNQASIEGILTNTNKITGDMARASPRIEGAMADLQATLQQAKLSLAAFEQVMGSTDKLLSSDKGSLASQMRATLASLDGASKALEQTLRTTQPAAQQLSNSTLPAAEATLRDLQAASRQLRSVVEKLDNQGAGALLRGSDLPDYKP
jgi:phospholipid/cholesterol/gamma-HCH transport system substrate-binding protein